MIIPYNPNTTPKQTLGINHFQNNPQVQLLIKTLDLIPAPSNQAKISNLVSDRITHFIETFKEASNLPVETRSAIKTGNTTIPRLFWTTEQINADVKMRFGNSCPF